MLLMAANSPMTTNTPALEIDGLEIHANSDDRALVDRLSFSLGRGERLAIAGESGSGKTMTASAVMGLLPSGVHKTAGRIRILGGYR